MRAFICRMEWSYPVAGLVRSFRAEGYDAVDHPLIPHGVSVIVNAPAYSGSQHRFSGRHLKAAEVLGAKTDRRRMKTPAKFSPTASWGSCTIWESRTACVSWDISLPTPGAGGRDAAAAPA